MEIRELIYASVFFSILIVVTTLGNIANPIVAISKAASVATGILAVIDAPRPRTEGLKDPDVSANEDIEFSDVKFAYPSRPNTAVLKNLNLRFKKEKTTAIVGPSGSGKSTIVGLLERWYQLANDNVSEEDDDSAHSKSEKNHPVEDAKDKEIITNSGSILVGGHDVTTLNMRWWRSQIGLVAQEPFLFNATIFQNIAYGLVGSKWEHADDEKKQSLVEEACAEACAESFI